MEVSHLPLPFIAKIYTFFRHLLSHSALALSVSCCLLGVWITTELFSQLLLSPHHTLWRRSLSVDLQIVSVQAEQGEHLNKQINDEFKMYPAR